MGLPKCQPTLKRTTRLVGLHFLCLWHYHLVLTISTVSPCFLEFVSKKWSIFNPKLCCINIFNALMHTTVEINLVKATRGDWQAVLTRTTPSKVTVEALVATSIKSLF